MNKPADPYNSASNRPFEDDPFLAPISEKEKEKEAELNPSSASDEAAAHAEAERKRAEQAAWENSFAQVDQARKDELAAPNANRSLADVAQGKPGVDSPVHDAVFADNIAGPQRTSVMPNSSFNEFLDDAFAEQPESQPAQPGVETVRERHERWAQDPGDINEIEAPTATAAATDEAAQLDASSPEQKVPSRAAAHVLSVLFTLLLLPIAWYLISDAGVRLFGLTGSQWNTGNFAIFPFVELMAGLATLAVLAAVATSSALGAMLWGGGIFLASAVFLAIPKFSANMMDSLQDSIGEFNPFTGNLAHHLTADLGSGRIAAFGFAVFLFGLVAAVARRRGKKRALLLAQIEG